MKSAIDSLNIFEIGSNCPVELMNPRKAVRRPEDFYNGIAKRQTELIQRKQTELLKKLRATQGFTAGINYFLHKQSIIKSNGDFLNNPSVNLPLTNHDANTNVLQAFLYFYITNVGSKNGEQSE